MLPHSQALQTTALALRPASLSRNFLALNTRPPTYTTPDNKLATVFDSWQHMAVEDIESNDSEWLESPSSNTSVEALHLTSQSDALAAFLPVDHSELVRVNEAAHFDTLSWFDNTDTAGTGNQPWLIAGLLCGVAAGGSSSSSGSAFAASSAPAMSTTPGWSAASGWGQPNVAHALALVKGANYQSAISQTGMHSYLDDMGFTTAWSQGYTGKGVVIASIDTGFDFKNPYLTAHMHFSAQCWNFVNDSANAQDDNGHGTMTASEMCAGPATGFGITGGAYDAELMVLKALDDNGHGISSQVSSAICYAVDHGAAVINLSLGQNNADHLIQNALSYAMAHDMVVVAAAGNSAASQPCYPAAYGMVMPHVIAVGATQTSNLPGTLAAFSNQAGTTQAYNFVTAPGENIIGFGTDEQLWSWSGTSVAAPLIAAQAALLASAQANQHARDIVQSIMQSADALEMMFGGPSAATGSAISPGSQAAYLYEKSVFVEDSKLKLSALPFEHMY